MLQNNTTQSDVIQHKIEYDDMIKHILKQDCIINIDIIWYNTTWCDWGQY